MGTTLLQQPETVISGRYRLGASLGHGGMGSVYAAFDRLAKQQVALKRITFGNGDRITSSADSYLDPRIALAQEFQVLARLRHPNIISVLDFGFDSDKQPYFTMDLVRNPQNILEAANDKPLLTKMDYLVQLLQALAYLHQRGFIHRDLKPGNILVETIQDENGESQTVKVLDLGLTTESEDDTNMAGTLAFMAPELLLGGPASFQSDLYSVGVIASQMVTGRHPYGDPGNSQFLHNVLHLSPNIYLRGLDVKLTTILAKLLKQNPSKRYLRAVDVLADLGDYINQPLAVETAATRESFLQAAKFVGRDDELGKLEMALSQARNGRGSSWLIAGESGVGKSRLANELRIRALVRGVGTLRSSAQNDVGNPYFIWQDILRQLLLTTTVKEQDAAILAGVFYQLDDLIGNDVKLISDLEPIIIQNRLPSIFETLFRQLNQPTLIILEDIQWARNESLDLLTGLVKRVADLPLIIVATVRSDEAGFQSMDLADMTLLKLERLSRAAVIQLSESMMGRAGRESRIVELLERETEGNPFFVVEVVRALAEEAGTLRHVATMTLPETIITSGLHNLIQRRVNKVKPEYQPLLRISAVAGQYLDLNFLKAAALENGVSDPEAWLTDCVNAAVLERQDNRWRFAHNKLREGILAELTEAEQKAIHQHIAHILETIYPNEEEKAAQLAFHWRWAGNQEKEVFYANIAGTKALRVWANHEASRFFEQVIEGLSELPQTAEHQQLYINTALKLSRVAAFDPSVDVLAYLDQAREYAETLQDEVQQAHIYSSIGAYHYVRVQMGQAFEYFQKCLVLAEKLSLESLLVLPYNLIGRAHANLGDYEQAAALLARGIPLAEQHNDLDLLAGSLVFYGLSLAYQGMWPEAESYTRRALTLAQNLNSPERIATNKMVAGIYHAYCGYWEEAQSLLAEALVMIEEQGALQLLFVCTGTLGFVYLRTGRFDEGCDYLEKCLALNKEHPQLSINLPMFHAYTAETLLLKEGWRPALQKAEEAIELAQAINQPMGQAQALQSLSRILQATPNPDWGRAEEALREAITIYEKGSGLTYIAICHLELGKLYAARGETAEAQTYLTKAHDLFTAYTLPWYQAQAEQALAQLGTQ